LTAEQAGTRWWSRHPRLSGLAVALAAVGLALLWSLHTWQGHNGDHAYYSAMALQYGGTGYDASLAEVARYFHYPPWERSLDLGFLNPTIAPLIYPRPLYPLLAALPVRMFGLAGVYVPGIAAGLVGTAAVAAAVRRRHRSPAALLALLLRLASRIYMEVGFGIYIDALVIACVALAVLCLPLRGPTTGWHVVALCSVAVLMMLSRQVPLVPIAMVGGGWLWATVGQRRLRNDWFPSLLAVLPATAAVWLVLDHWAPYDPFPFLEDVTGKHSRGALVAAMPGLLADGLGNAAETVLTRDFALIPFFVLATVGLWRARRTPLAGVAVGLTGACLVTLALNNRGELRYLAPVFPVAALLAADTAVGLWHRLRRGAAEVVPVAPGGAPTPRERRLVRSAAVVGVLATLGTAVGTVLVNQPASLDGAPQVRVSRDRIQPWPLSVPQGRLICAGDDLEMWFRRPNGTLYALSGTAMSSSFFRPRITELAAGDMGYKWPDLQPLLDLGNRLCRRASGPAPLG
jgi:hypothetical protein